MKVRDRVGIKYNWNIINKSWGIRDKCRAVKSRLIDVMTSCQSFPNLQSILEIFNLQPAPIIKNKRERKKEKVEKQKRVKKLRLSSQKTKSLAGFLELQIWPRDLSFVVERNWFGRSQPESDTRVSVWILNENGRISRDTTTYQISNIPTPFLTCTYPLIYLPLKELYQLYLSFIFF